MSEAGADIVTFRKGVDLCFILQAPEGG